MSEDKAEYETKQGNMDIYNAVSRPPREALKQIGAGRLKGMTDINPQWRIKALTEQFGPCGIGWYYKRTNTWNESTQEGEVLTFVDIDLFVKNQGEWSSPIPGSGGAMLISKEKVKDYDLPHEKERGYKLYASDEAIKMATTDALSVACKLLGIGAEIYAGRWDGSKYKDDQNIDTSKQDKAYSDFQKRNTEEYKKKCDDAAKKLDIDQFKLFYPGIKADVAKDCGATGEKIVYTYCLDLYAKKVSEAVN